MAENQAPEKELIKHDAAAFIQGATAPSPKPAVVDNSTEAAPVSLVPSKEATIPEQTTDTPAAETESTEADEDAKWLEGYNKRLGTKYKTIAEMQKATEKEPEPVVLTAEEKAAADQKRKAEALAWKVEQDPKFKDTYEKAIADKEKSDRDIALKVFSEKELAKDKTLTSDELEEMFKDEYNEEAEENSPKAKRSAERIAREAEAYRKEQYKEVDSYENDYAGYKELEGKFKSFGKQTKEVLEALPKSLTFEIPYIGLDNKEAKMEIPFEIAEDDIKGLKKEFNQEDMFFKMNANSKPVDNDSLSQAIIARFQEKRMKDIVKHVGLEVMARTEKEVLARVKNVPNTSNMNGSFLGLDGQPKAKISHPATAFSNRAQ